MVRLKFIEEFRRSELAKGIVAHIRQRSKTPARLMAFCGGHTVTIFKHGIRQILPKTLDKYAHITFVFDAFLAYEKASEDLTSTKSKAFILLLNKMLWIRNGLYRLITQQPDTPGLTSFKRWFSMMDV